MSEREEGERPEQAQAGELGGEETEAADTTQLPALARPSELVPPEIRDVSFGVAMRGYDRGEVDAYVEEVNRVIAELEIGRSPQSAVKAALDRVGEQTTSILQQAREAAEELTAAAAAESEHATRRARVEAEELRERAQSESRELLERSERHSEQILARSQAQLAELRAEIEETASARAEALAQLRATAAALEVFAADAEREPPAGGGGSADARAEDASEQPTAAMPPVEAGEPLDSELDDPPAPGSARRPPARRPERPAAGTARERRD